MNLKKALKLPWTGFSFVYRRLVNLSLESKITKCGPSAKVEVADPFLRVTIDRRKGARFNLNGHLTFEPWARNKEPVYIKLGEESTLTINGDFTIGPGCRIIVSPGAHLIIGGRRNESGSGITERGLLMVRRRMLIGVDTIIAWGCYITDCDWHETVGFSNTEDTVIGDHVWITPNCSILKGSQIGNGCIVATGAVTHKAVYPERCLIGGVPARVLAQDRKWSRDLRPLEPGPL